MHKDFIRKTRFFFFFFFFFFFKLKIFLGGVHGVFFCASWFSFQWVERTGSPWQRNVNKRKTKDQKHKQQRTSSSSSSSPQADSRVWYITGRALYSKSTSLQKTEILSK